MRSTGSNVLRNADALLEDASSMEIGTTSYGDFHELSQDASFIPGWQIPSDIPVFYFDPVFTEGDDTFGGTPNADNYDALGGNDTIFGSAGADLINGNNGFDTVDYTGSQLGIMLDMKRTVGAMGLTGDAEGDTLLNVERVIGSNFGDVIVGSNAGMTLVGGIGDDFLTGGSGNDRIEGGVGNDTLRGDAPTGSSRVATGVDQFVVGFNTGTDLIVDFQEGQDKILVKGIRGEDAFGHDHTLAFGYFSDSGFHSSNFDGDRLFYNVQKDQLCEVVRLIDENGHDYGFKMEAIATFTNDVTLRTFDFDFA